MKTPPHLLALLRQWNQADRDSADRHWTAHRITYAHAVDRLQLALIMDGFADAERVR